MELSSYISIKDSNQNWHRHTSVGKQKRESHLLNTRYGSSYNASTGWVCQQKAKFFLLTIMIKSVVPNRTRSKSG